MSITDRLILNWLIWLWTEPFTIFVKNEFKLSFNKLPTELLFFFFSLCSNRLLTNIYKNEINFILSSMYWLYISTDEYWFVSIISLRVGWNSPQSYLLEIGSTSEGLLTDLSLKCSLFFWCRSVYGQLYIHIEQLTHKILLFATVYSSHWEKKKSIRY
jgi:hypothetical protein